MKLKKFLAALFAGLYLVAFDAIFLALFFNTKNYSMDLLSEELSASMGTDKDIEKRAILSINQHEAKPKVYFFRDLLQQSNGVNSFGDRRVVINNSFKWNDEPIHLETQSNYHTSYTTDDYGYRYIQIDYGTYSTYFLDTDLVNRKVGKHESFILISDTFARKLIDYYKLDDGTSTEVDLFKKLVLDEQTSSLTLKSLNMTMDLRITNIIRTDFLGGVRTNQLYGDFGSFYISEKIDSSKLSINYETDLKNNSTCIKNTFSFLNGNDYGPDKCKYSFKTFSSDGYQENTHLKERYYEALSKKSNHTAILVTFFISFFLTNFALIMLMTPLGKNIEHFEFYVFVGCAVAFVIYGICAQFIYIYPLLTIPPVICVIESFYLAFEDIRDAFKRIFRRKKETC